MVQAKAGGPGRELADVGCGKGGVKTLLMAKAFPKVPIPSAFDLP